MIVSDAFVESGFYQYLEYQGKNSEFTESEAYARKGAASPLIQTVEVGKYPNAFDDLISWDYGMDYDTETTQKRYTACWKRRVVTISSGTVTNDLIDAGHWFLHENATGWQITTGAIGIYTTFREKHYWYSLAGSWTNAKMRVYNTQGIAAWYYLANIDTDVATYDGDPVSPILTWPNFNPATDSPFHWAEVELGTEGPTYLYPNLLTLPDNGASDPDREHFCREVLAFYPNCPVSSLPWGHLTSDPVEPTSADYPTTDQ